MKDSAQAEMLRERVETFIARFKEYRAAIDAARKNPDLDSHDIAGLYAETVGMCSARIEGLESLLSLTEYPD